ncbi:peptidyl-prolyl cis-trans isomerase [Rhodovulum visakhapatnamense]|uniref:Parvulin-like PPIase n=1 Tax=Rhodovulum visakhapatnamense TaxID=364297 RepID=A0A4R8FN38_9RHOB|nr:peptidyl-prolyl cis-trans isomerase [Rhodovulum visakhapatnamense]TDX27689.1 peptidyl-prolyl cis-trans isomerase D [Rhodovulum visakhapatnamense]
MSKSKGKQFSKTLVWLMLIFVVLGLGGFGVSNFGGRVEAIGSVGDTKISTDTYARALQRELRARAAATGGQTMSIAEAQSTGLVDAIRAQVISNAALDNEMARIGVSVGDDQVAREVMRIDAFKGPDGSFDREAYRYTLSQNGLTEAQFETSLRDEAARSLLQTAVVAGLNPPKTYVDTLYTFIAERRSVSLIHLTAEDLDAPVPDPTGDDLTAQYEATPAAYTAPMTRKITYAWLTPEMMADRIEPDEELLHQLYQEHIDEFVQPEKRLVERLVFADMTEAQAAWDKIASGEESFDDAVAARGLSIDDIDLGDVSEVQIGGAAGQAVFALTEPGLAGPVMSDLGPAIFRVNAILAKQEIPFEEARETLAPEAVHDRAVRMIADKMSDFDDLLAAGATLEDLARETDMELGEIDYTANSDQGIAAYQDFREAANAAVEGDFPEVKELDDGGIFALRLDGETPPTLRPLDAVRDQVAEDWRAAETARELAAKAEALKARVENGEDMAALGPEVTSESALSRGGLMPQPLSDALFALGAEGDTAVVPSGDEVWLIRLDAILPPDGNDPGAEALRQSIASQASQGIAQDLYSSFAQAVINAAGLSLDQAAINAVHAQFR